MMKVEVEYRNGKHEIFSKDILGILLMDETIIHILDLDSGYLIK